MAQDLAQMFIDMDTQLRINYYRRLLKQKQGKDEALSADESFCLDAIAVLKRPTIGKFAHYMQISPQSAAYKVNNLVRKGYITRTRGSDDKREFYLSVTEKYDDHMKKSNEFLYNIGQQLSETYADQDIEKAVEIIRTVIDAAKQEEADLS